jgi:hypothetical protein
MPATRLPSGAPQRRGGGQLLGAPARKLVVKAENVASLGRRIPESAGQHRTDGVEPVLERGDHAEVAASAPDPPEEVLVLLLAGRQQPPVRGDHVGREEVVAGEAVLAVEPAETASEGQSGYACHRDDPEGRCQPERLRLVVELAQGKARLGPRPPPRRIHPHALHGRQVEHQAAVAHRLARDVVAAAAYREQEIVRVGEVDAPDHVGGARATNDQRWALVDHAVEDGASSVVAVFFRAHDLAA